MAKLLGIFQFSGKLGQTVGLKGANGENYVRVNVKPTNKNSGAQVDQRVKMSLAGLISKLTAPDLIIGMGSTTRDRRNRFTGTIARNAEATTNSEGAAIAKLAPEKLIFSDGRLLPVPSELSTTFNGTALSVNYAGTYDENTAGYLVIGAFSDGDEYVRIDGTLLTPTETSGSIEGTGTGVNVYVIPIVRADGATNISYQRAVEDLATSNDYAAATRGVAAGSLVYGASVYAGRRTQG